MSGDDECGQYLHRALRSLPAVRTGSSLEELTLRTLEM